MLLNGDVLAVVAFFLTGAITLWGTLVACGLLFPNKTQIAQDRITGAPWKTFFAGLAVTLVLGTLGVALLNAPAPLNAIGGIVLFGLISVSMVGNAGLASLASERISGYAPGLPRYATLARGAGFVIMPSLLPFIGWFFLGAILLIMGVGAGWVALFGKSRAVVEPNLEAA